LKRRRIQSGGEGFLGRQAAKGERKIKKSTPKNKTTKRRSQREG